MKRKTHPTCGVCALWLVCVVLLCVVQVAIQSALACCRILMVVLMVATTLTAYDPNRHDFPDQSGESVSHS